MRNKIYLICARLLVLIGILNEGRAFEENGKNFFSVPEKNLDSPLRLNSGLQLQTVKRQLQGQTWQPTAYSSPNYISPYPRAATPNKVYTIASSRDTLRSVPLPKSRSIMNQRLVAFRRNNLDLGAGGPKVYHRQNQEAQSSIDSRLFLFRRGETAQNPGIPLSFDRTAWGTDPPPVNQRAQDSDDRSSERIDYSEIPNTAPPFPDPEFRRQQSPKVAAVDRRLFLYRRNKAENSYPLSLSQQLQIPNTAAPLPDSGFRQQQSPKVAAVDPRLFLYRRNKAENSSPLSLSQQLQIPNTAAPLPDPGFRWQQSPKVAAVDPRLFLYRRNKAENSSSLPLSQQLQGPSVHSYKQYSWANEEGRRHMINNGITMGSNPTRRTLGKRMI